MSAKQLARLGLVFLALVLLWGAAALRRHVAASPGKREALRLPPIARAAVDTVTLVKAGDTTVLARADSSHWTANGHPASAPAIAELLDALSDTAVASELVAERRSSHASLGVDSAGGTRVRVSGHGRTLADLVAGQRSSDFSGGYLRLADQEPTWLVHGRLVESLTRPADEWRDHRIAAVPADSVATIEVTRGAHRYALRREGGHWIVSPGGAADSAAAAQLLESYRTVEANGFATPAQADSARFTPADRRARLLRKDGTPLVTLLFDSTASGTWVKADTGGTIYRMDVYSAERLAPADSTLRPKPRASTAKPAKAAKAAGH